MHNQKKQAQKHRSKSKISESMCGAEEANTGEGATQGR